MIARIATDDDRDAWNAYVSGLSGVPPINYEWSYILHESYKIPAYFFIAEDRGKIYGVCPTYIVRDWRKRKYLYSLKFGLQGSGAAKEKFMQSVEKFCDENNIYGDAIASGSVSIATARIQTIKKTVLLHLPGTADEAWKGLRNKTRNMIRKAERAGLKVVYGAQNLCAFYDIYVRRMLDKNIPIHSYSFFDHVLAHLRKNAELIVATKDNLVVGGIVVLFGNDYALYPYQVSRAGAERFAPTQLLIWEAMKMSIARGVRILDMGESKEGSPVYESKINFGGTPRDVYYYHTKRVTSLSSSGSIARMFPYFPYALKMRVGIWMKRKGKIM